MSTISSYSSALTVVSNTKKLISSKTTYYAFNYN